MNKVKVSSSLAAVVLIGSMFAGLATFLTVVALLVLFADVDNVKDVIVKTASFYIGLTLVSIAWGLIYDAYNDVLLGGVDSIINLINSYVDKPINPGKFYQYVLDPIGVLFKYANVLVTYLITFSKFAFAVALFSNKAPKQNAFTNFVSKYVDKIISFVNTKDQQAV